MDNKKQKVEKNKKPTGQVKPAPTEEHKSNQPSKPDSTGRVSERPSY